MSCSSPRHIVVKGKYDGLTRQYDVACGQCLCCRMEKQSQLEFLASKDLYSVYKSGLGASFVTFTYNEDYVPYRVQFAGYPTDYVVHGLKEAQAVAARFKRFCPNAECTFTQTLVKSDLQKFFKRMRINMTRAGCDIKFKHISCGEYGDKFGRPHYHCVFLGLSDVLAANFTKDAWPYGIVDVGALRSGGLRYVLKYCTKANQDPDVKALRDSLSVQRPYLVHSLGLGKDWILANKDSLIEHPFFRLGGKEIPLPRYVRTYLQNFTTSPYTFDCIKHKTLLEQGRIARAQGYNTVDDYLSEKAYLKERFLFESLTSKGIVVDRGILRKRIPNYRHKIDNCKNFIKILCENP